jgi:hypothetical protein
LALQKSGAPGPPFGRLRRLGTETRTLAICYGTSHPQVVRNVTDREVQRVYRGPLSERIFATQENWTVLVVPIGQVARSWAISLVPSSWAGTPPAGRMALGRGVCGPGGHGAQERRRYDAGHCTASLLSATLLPGEQPDVASYQAEDSSHTRRGPSGGRLVRPWTRSSRRLAVPRPPGVRPASE